MKKVLLSLLFVLVIVSAVAFGVRGPFPPWIEKLAGDVTYNASGSASLSALSVQTADIALLAVDTGQLAAASVDEDKLALPTIDGLNAKRILRSTYDVAVDGGTVAAHALSESLPANAIVSQVWFQIITQFVDAGSGTVALSCAGANDLFSAADITGDAAGVITAGVPVGTAATMFDVGSTCVVTATVATAAQSAGKMVIFIEYVVTD